MANYPNKKDPAETALSAIQEALSASEAQANGTRSRPTAPSEPVSPETARLGGRISPTPVDTDLFDGKAPPSAADDASPARRAANDDRQSIGQILQSLQRRPPKTSYLIATLFALAWIAGGLIVAGLYLPDLRQGPAAAPALAGLAAVVLAPVLFFYVLAHMVWRSQELRLIAQSMAGVAMRLAEPEDVARASIVSVGHAIPPEVAPMGDGVERARARAAERAALVAHEGSALERA